MTVCHVIWSKCCDDAYKGVNDWERTERKGKSKSKGLKKVKISKTLRKLLKLSHINGQLAHIIYLQNNAIT